LVKALWTRIASYLRPANGTVSPDARWEALIKAAAQTDYYQEPPVLSSTAPLALGEYYEQVHRFRNPRARHPQPAPLASPWKAPVSVVCLLPWFPLEGRVRVLSRLSCQKIEESRPEALAAPVVTLRAVAAAVEEGRLQLPNLRYGLLAWSGFSRPLLTAADRDKFWRVFQVPVFEQFRGFHGELLAAECYVHEGLHVETDNACWEQRLDGGDELLVTSFANLRHPALRLATGLVGYFNESACPCGRTEPRLFGLRPASGLRAPEDAAALSPA
jgi:hypothetical protein